MPISECTEDIVESLLLTCVARASVRSVVRARLQSGKREREVVLYDASLAQQRGERTSSSVGGEGL